MKKEEMFRHINLNALVVTNGMKNAIKPTVHVYKASLKFVHVAVTKSDKVPTAYAKSAESLWV